MKNGYKEQNILGNFIYNAGFQLLKIFLPLVTTPYVSRVLGTNGLGIYSYTYTVAGYFAIFAFLGFENYGNRLIAVNREDKDNLNRAFSGTYYVQLLSSSIAVIAYLIYLLVFCKENHLVAQLQLLYVCSEFFNLSWLFFGLEEFKKTTISNTCVKLISLVLIFTFVKEKSDIEIYAIIVSGSTLVSYLILWIQSEHYVRLVRVPLKEIWKHAKGTLTLFFPVLAICVYRSTDKVMLGKMASMSEVAIYANADKIVEIPYGIIVALGVVMLPHMTGMAAKGEKEKVKKYINISLRLMSFMACGMAFGLVGIGNNFSRVFFGREFEACGPLIMLMAPMIIVRACANVVRTQFLLPNHRDRDYITSIALGIFINLFLNAIYIPRSGSAGAALATLVAESFVAMYQIYVTRRDLPVLRYIARNWFFLVGGAIMAVAVYFIGKTREISISLVVLQFLVGVVVYLVLAGTYLLVKEKELLSGTLGRGKNRH